MTEADLSTELRRRAEASAEAILRSARQEANRVLEDADAEVEARRNRAVRTSERVHREESRSSIAAARHEALRVVLVAREGLLARVFERARTLLGDACDMPSYRNALLKDVNEALEFVGDQEAVVRCSEGLSDLIATGLIGRGGARIEPLETHGHGFLVVGGDGQVEVDGTLENRLERLSPGLAIEILTRVEERSQ
jgi:vacuolar-type H+-ATPase subunit E/Vma4